MTAPRLKENFTQHSVSLDLAYDYLAPRLLDWGSANFDDFPWRHTTNLWHAIAAEVMLQRTNAKQVLGVYSTFVKKYPLPADYIADREARIFDSLGLKWREKPFRLLAERLQKTALTETTDLKDLPGVGDYISAAMRSLHLRQRDVIIDSNIVRLYGRFFGFKTDGETRRKKWLKSLADCLTPDEKVKEFNYALIDFTRKVCKPSPLCQRCPLNSRCHFRSS